ncbi:uncharacterized protein [Onthophagus taurus]|uniref:uncharacterized protein n=1 Tax=Onthophagus taurus TaxID=166361 RepID=UPI0039BEC768
MKAEQVNVTLSIDSVPRNQQSRPAKELPPEVIDTRKLSPSITEMSQEETSAENLLRPMLSITTTRTIKSGHKKRKMISYLQRLSSKPQIGNPNVMNNLRKLKRQTIALRNRNCSLKARLHKANEMLKNNPLHFFDNINPTVLNFCKSQLKFSKYKPRGRRYSMQDKLFALSLYKQSGRSYRFLSTFFSLPSRGTITRLLQMIPIRAGLNNEIIYENLTSEVRKLKKEHRICVLMFDEVFLDVNISYNRKLDAFVGFEDMGKQRSTQIADRVLVFMIQGIIKKFKQPIAYLFACGGVKSHTLAQLIKEIICRLDSCGLEVIGTVCDQATTNQSAINISRKLSPNYTENENTFSVNNRRIIALYDPPHLLKGIRKQLLNKNLV